MRADQHVEPSAREAAVRSTRSAPSVGLVGGPQVEEATGSSVGAWWSPRAQGVTSVNSHQHALRQQLYETQSELGVQQTAMCAHLPRSSRTRASTRRVPSCPNILSGVTLISIQDKRPTTPPQPYK